MVLTVTPSLTHSPLSYSTTPISQNGNGRLKSGVNPQVKWEADSVKPRWPHLLISVTICKLMSLLSPPLQITVSFQAKVSKPLYVVVSITGMVWSLVSPKSVISVEMAVPVSFRKVVLWLSWILDIILRVWHVGWSFLLTLLFPWLYFWS